MDTKLFMKSSLALGMLGVAAILPNMAHSTVLPGPLNTCSFNGALLCYTAENGDELYVASQHDEFISYNRSAIEYYIDEGYNFDEFDNGAGSGNILKLFGFNNATNDTFPDQTTDTQNSPFSGVWPGPGDTFSVGDLQGVLGPDQTTPVFAFDFQQPQPDYVMWMSGYFTVMRDGAVYAQFSFDNVFDGLANTPDPENIPTGTTSLVPVPTDLLLQYITAADGVLHTVPIDTSAGSGAADFYGYTPLFDINDYLSTDLLTFNLYTVDINMESGNYEIQDHPPTSEELYLDTSVQAPPNNQIPEPATMALLGLGWVGLGFLNRRKSIQKGLGV